FLAQSRPNYGASHVRKAQPRPATIGGQLGNAWGTLDKKRAILVMSELWQQGLNLGNPGAWPKAGTTFNCGRPSSFGRFQTLVELRPWSNSGTPGRRMNRTSTAPAVMPPTCAHQATPSAGAITTITSCDSAHSPSTNAAGTRRGMMRNTKTHTRTRGCSIR